MNVLMTGFHTPIRKPCPCGSGEPRRDLVDALGIFCAFVCDRCEVTKRAGFNPAIFDGRTYPADELIEPEWPDPADPEPRPDPVSADDFARRVTASSALLATPDTPADTLVTLRISGNALVSLLNAADERAAHHDNQRLAALVSAARDVLSDQRLKRFTDDTPSR